VVLRMLDRYGELLDPEAIARHGRKDPAVLTPTVQFRMARGLEPPGADEGFAAIEIVPFQRAPRPGAEAAGALIALEAVTRDEGGEPVLRDDAELALAAVPEGAPCLLVGWRPGAEAGVRERARDLAESLSKRAGRPVELGLCVHPAGPPVCWCRPPLPGLWLAFAERWGIDPRRSVLVGGGTAHAAMARALGLAHHPWNDEDGRPPGESVRSTTVSVHPDGNLPTRWPDVTRAGRACYESTDATTRGRGTMILVTGATGNVGGGVLAQLVEARQAVRALARDPAKLGGRGVEVVRGDLGKPETLDAAFAGADKVFLMCAGGDMTALAGNGVAAAKRAGVKHLVFLSSTSAKEGNETILGGWHRAAEVLVEESGIAHTLLRPGAFASNVLRWIGSIKAQGAVFLPTGDGKISPIDPDDIAAVAVHVLTTAGHEGKTYDLTGPEALSNAELVAKIGGAVGRPLRFVDVSDATAREGMEKAGMPEPFIAAILQMSAQVRAGRGGTVMDTVERLLGRKARTFDQWLERHAKQFA
jgi:uncharacterized protein YbjT (DUF2867 family)